MSIDINSLEIGNLSVVERLHLIERIWDTLPQEFAAENIPQWHREELDKRRREADEQPGVGRPWRDVLEELGSKP
jgi:putative addiction module component (TIGR02574 family)